MTGRLAFAVQRFPRALLTCVLVLPPTVLTARAPAGPPDESFTLGRYVPQSCFLYAHGVANPDRAVVQRHWQRVFDALADAGLPDVVRDAMSSSLDREGRAEFRSRWNKLTELVTRVSWKGLIERERCLAVRLAPYPSVLVMGKGRPGSGHENLTALLNILRYAASLDERIHVAKERCCGLKVWNLTVPGTPVSVHLFARGDTIGAATSEPLAREVIGLMSGYNATGAIIDSPKFQHAAARLPQAQDLVSFLDWEALNAEIGHLADALAAGAGERPAAGPGLTVVHRLIERINVLDFTLSVRGTKGLRQTGHTLTVLKADQGRDPLVQAFIHRPPLKDPLSVVPAEAVAFSADAGCDLGALYSLALEFIDREVPGGTDALAAWRQVQDEYGIDIQEDVLSWVSGEWMTISLPTQRRHALLNTDEVLLLKVTDAELADRKVRAGLSWLVEFLQVHFHLPLLVKPATGVEAEGFQTVFAPVLPILGEIVVGVHGNSLIVATSSQAVNRCLATSTGKAPSIAESPRFLAEGIPIAGPVQATSFQDMESVSAGMEAMLVAAGLASYSSACDAQDPWASAALNLVSRLPPVLSKIDFRSSYARATTLDGLAFKTETVINYKPLEDGGR